MPCSRYLRPQRFLLSTLLSSGRFVTRCSTRIPHGGQQPARSWRAPVSRLAQMIDSFLLLLILLPVVVLMRLVVCGICSSTVPQCFMMRAPVVTFEHVDTWLQHHSAARFKRHLLPCALVVLVLERLRSLQAEESRCMTEDRWRFKIS